MWPCGQVACVVVWSCGQEARRPGGHHFELWPCLAQSIPEGFTAASLEASLLRKSGWEDQEAIKAPPFGLSLLFVSTVPPASPYSSVCHGVSTVWLQMSVPHCFDHWIHQPSFLLWLL